MDRHNFRFVSIHFFINLHHFVAERGFLTVFPCRISALDLVSSSKEFCQILDFVRKGVPCSLYGASYAGASEKFILRKLHNTDVCRGFHKSLNAAAHLLDSEWDFHKIEQDFFSAGRMKDHFGACAHFCDLNGDPGVRSGIFFS